MKYAIETSVAGASPHPALVMLAIPVERLQMVSKRKKKRWTVGMIQDAANKLAKIVTKGFKRCPHCLEWIEE